MAEDPLESANREGAEGTAHRAAQRQLEHQRQVGHEAGRIRHVSRTAPHLPLAPARKAWVADLHPQAVAPDPREPLLNEVAIPGEGLGQLASVLGQFAKEHKRCRTRIDVEPRVGQRGFRIAEVRVVKLLVQRPELEETLECRHVRDVGRLEGHGPLELPLFQRAHVCPSNSPYVRTVTPLYEFSGYVKAGYRFPSLCGSPWCDGDIRIHARKRVGQAFETFGPPAGTDNRAESPPRLPASTNT